MRLSRWLAPVAVFSVWIVGGTVLAVPGDEDHGEVVTYVELAGFANPPGHQDGHCTQDEFEGYRDHVSEPTGLVRDDQEVSGYELPTGTVVVNYAGLPQRFDIEERFDVEFIRWRTGCANDDDPFDIVDETLSWVRVPSQTSVVPDLLAELRGRLDAPTVTWPDRDREFGWLYVNAPMDFRITPIDTVRIDVTITNVAGSVTSWVRAEPGSVVFDSGEPDAQATICSYEHAIAPYSIEAPGVCAHRYSNSSAIMPAATFATTVSVLWDVTSSAPLAVNDGVSSFSENIAVAEVQALEVAR